MASGKERELRRSMVKACAALFQKNLVAATDGNVSARLSDDRILVTPSGVNKGDVTERDILLCDLNGRKIRGPRGGEISSEVRVHLAAYRARQDIGAVVHAHPPIATAFTFAGMDDLLREPILPEVVSQIGPIPTVPYITPGSPELAEAAGVQIANCDIVMLAQHGAVSVGKDPWAAYLRMDKLEQLALIVKTAFDLCGDLRAIKRLTPEQIEDLNLHYGSAKFEARKSK